MFQRRDVWAVSFLLSAQFFSGAAFAVHSNANSGGTSCLICGSDAEFLYSGVGPANVITQCTVADGEDAGDPCPAPQDIDYGEPPEQVTFRANFQLGSPVFDENDEIRDADDNIAFGGYVSQLDPPVFVENGVSFWRLFMLVSGVFVTCDPGDEFNAASCTYDLFYDQLDGNQSETAMPQTTVVGHLIRDANLDEEIPGDLGTPAAAMGSLEAEFCQEGKGQQQDPDCLLEVDFFIEDGLRNNSGNPRVGDIFPLEGDYQFGQILDYAVTAIESNNALPVSSVSRETFGLRKCHRGFHNCRVDPLNGDENTCSPPDPTALISGESCEKQGQETLRSLTNTELLEIVHIDFRPNTQNQTNQKGSNVASTYVLSSKDEGEFFDLSTVAGNTVCFNGQVGKMCGDESGAEPPGCEAPCEFAGVSARSWKLVPDKDGDGFPDAEAKVREDVLSQLLGDLNIVVVTGEFGTDQGDGCSRVDDDDGCGTFQGMDVTVPR